ncbi:MAG: hypothetical protein V6Z81_04410 [Parvularculales bacterium]
MTNIKPKTANDYTFGIFSKIAEAVAIRLRFVNARDPEPAEQSEVTEIVLSEEDARLFEASLENPSPPTRRAVKAAEAYRRRVKSAA